MWGVHDGPEITWWKQIYPRYTAITNIILNEIKYRNIYLTNKSPFGTFRNSHSEYMIIGCFFFIFVRILVACMRRRSVNVRGWQWDTQSPRNQQNENGFSSNFFLAFWRIPLCINYNVRFNVEAMAKQCRMWQKQQNRKILIVSIFGVVAR